MVGSLPGLDASPNIHPVFIHFPIALWFAALAFWLVALIFRKERLWEVGRWLLDLGLVGALFAIGTGLWAEAKLGHDSPGHELVRLHKNLMLAASGIAALTALVAHVWRGSTSPTVRIALVVLMTSTAAATTFGADRGALVSIQHGGHDHAATEESDAHDEHAHDQGAPAQDPAAEVKQHSHAKAGDRAPAPREHRHERTDPAKAKKPVESAPHDHGSLPPAKVEDAAHDHEDARAPANEAGGHDHQHAHGSHSHSSTRNPPPADDLDPDDDFDDADLSYD